MKRIPLVLLCAFLLGVPTAASAVVFIWNGIGPTGWKYQVAPPNDGTANLVYSDNVSTFIPIPSPNFDINSVSFVSDNRFLFVPQSGSSILNLGAGGITMNNPYNGSTIMDFAYGITVNLASAQTWDFGSSGGSAIIHGVLSGSGNLLFTGSSTNNTAALLLSNPLANANSGYSGNITVGSSTVPNFFPVVVLWASGNLGTGSLTFVNGGQIVTHNATTIANNLILNSGPLPPGQLNGGVSAFQSVFFRAWDAPLYLTGSTTLANNTTLTAQFAFPDLPTQFPGNTGSWPLPGPRTREPVVFSGTVGESGGARSLNITGPGLVILAGNNTSGAYTGGTGVGFSTGSTSGQQGSLIFASQNAIPAAGTIQVGLTSGSTGSGYVGIADTAVLTPGAFNTFLTRFNASSTGAVGLDSLNGSNAPDSTPHVFSDNINLGYFTNGAGNGLKLGTATSIILTGTITAQRNNLYSFGNGGGKMYVQSALPNLSGGATSLINNSNGSFALQLFLQGTNTYTGGTTASNSVIVFDGSASIPATGSLVAGGANTNIGSSYIGFTNTTLGGTAVNGSAGSGGLAESGVGLFNKFNKASTWGIIGFDSTSLGSPTTVSNLDLTGFNNGAYVGTTSAAVLTGTITPTSVATTQPANTFRFTASAGGVLTVDSVLGGIGFGVTVGTPSGIPTFSDGTVVLNGVNTYTGGTTIYSPGNPSIVAGNSSAFGTGAVSLQPNGGLLGLSAGTGGVNLANSLVFVQAAPGTGATPTLNLTGSNGFTLSGSISGPDRSAIYTPNDVGQGLIALNNVSPLNVTVSGNNSSFYGTFLVQNGTLTFASDSAPGHAQIQMSGSAGTVSFTSLSPVVYGLWNGDGGGGTITLGTSTNLTVDTTDNDQDYEWEFGGSLVGASTSSLTLTGTSNTEFFYLYGNSPGFSGNVYVTNQSGLALGQNDSVGSGTVTLGATQGGIILNTGVTFTNPLVFNSGGLAGIGTFAPSSISGTGQTAGKITFGPNQAVFPGIPDSGSMLGTLTLATDVIFANGGEFVLMVQDPAAVNGFGHLAVTGSLDLNSISTGFLFTLETSDANGDPNPAPTITNGSSYSLLIVTATGGITGFNPAVFTFDVTNFQGGLIPSAFFNVSADSTHLYLNFTAVPEPSTWALFATGTGVLGLAAWRRRRA